MQSNLTRHVMAWIGEGQNLFPISDVIQFEVRGLPTGEQAWTAKFSNRWRILRAKDGVHQGGWSGNYKNEDEAFEALQKGI